MVKSDQKVIAAIPARGGSKGLPGKNIRLLAGKPLLAYAIEAAKSTTLIDRVIVTTDHEEIAAIEAQRNYFPLNTTTFYYAPTSLSKRRINQFRPSISFIQIVVHSPAAFSDSVGVLVSCPEKA